MKYGNMNGSYGYASDVYGWASGDSTGDHITVDPSNGVRFIDGADSNKVIGQFSGQIFTLGESAGEHVTIDNSGASLGVTVNAGAFDLNAGQLHLVGNGASSYISLGTHTAIDSTSTTGIYGNNDGHLIAGSTDGSGNLSKGFKWDGTNALLEAGNASIGANSGSFGPSGVLTYNATEVGLAGFTANDTFFRAITGETYVSTSILEYAGSSGVDEEFRSNTGFTVWRNDSDITGGENAFKAIRIGRISAKDDYNDFSGNEWGVQMLRRNQSANYEDVLRFDSAKFIFGGANITPTEFYSTNNGGDFTNKQGMYQKWESGAEQILVGDVFQADAGADEGQLAGANFDTVAMWGGATAKSSATAILGWATPKLQLGAAASSITATSNEGIYLDGTGVFNFAIDSNNYIRNFGSKLRMRSTDFFLSGGDGTDGYTGVQSGTGTAKAFFAGADDTTGTNANAYIRADGYLYSGSIGDSIQPAPVDIAANGRNQASASYPSSLTNNTSSYVAASQSVPSNEHTVEVIHWRVRKKPGTTRILCSFWAKNNYTQGDPANVVHWSTQVRLKGSTGITTDSVDITSTSYTRYTLEATFSSADLFNGGIEKDIWIEVYSKVNILSYSSGTPSAETFLNKDLLFLEQLA